MHDMMRERERLTGMLRERETEHTCDGERETDRLLKHA